MVKSFLLINSWLSQTLKVETSRLNFKRLKEKCMFAFWCQSMGKIKWLFLEQTLKKD